MEIITSILPFLVFIALAWFTFTNISYLVTIYRAKKDDGSLSFCLTNTGKYFYIGMLAVYLILFIICAIIMIIALLSKKMGNLYAPLNIITIASIGVALLLQEIILVGHRQMMIGKIKFDYRKIKRVSYPKAKKLRFVYGQRSLETPLRFIDDFKLKKALQKAR